MIRHDLSDSPTISRDLATQLHQQPPWSIKIRYCSIAIIFGDVRNNDTDKNTQHKCRRTLLFRYEWFINSWLWSITTRGERHNSYYADHTIWPHQRAVHLVMFKISVGRDPKIPTTSSTIENLTLCPNGRELNYLPPWSNINFQLTLFQNPQILRTISSGVTLSTLQPYFLSGVYYDNCDCHILCARA